LLLPEQPAEVAEAARLGVGLDGRGVRRENLAALDAYPLPAEEELARAGEPRIGRALEEAADDGLGERVDEGRRDRRVRFPAGGGARRAAEAIEVAGFQGSRGQQPVAESQELRPVVARVGILDRGQRVRANRQARLVEEPRVQVALARARFRRGYEFRAREEVPHIVVARHEPAAGTATE